MKIPLRLPKGMTSVALFSRLCGIVAVSALWTGCDSSDDSSDSVTPMPVPDGTTRYELLVVSSHTSLDPDLMTLTKSGDHVSGSITSGSIGGCGVIDGVFDTTARTMNLTITLSNGQALPCSIALFPNGTAIESCAITTASGVVQCTPDRLTPETHAATDYGVTDAGAAAIVVSDNSAAFAMASVRVRGCVDCFDHTYSPGKGDAVVAQVPPGPYRVEVKYTAKSGIWLCQNTAYDFDGVAVEAGSAAVFSLEGGSPCTGLYTPPDLVKK